jgi:hypothetical protein
MKEHLLTLTAYHEAAHSVVLFRATGSGANPVSIVARDGILGSASDSGVLDTTSADDIEAEIVSLYAGGHAQRRIDPTSGSDGCDGDEEDAEMWLTRLGATARESELRERSFLLVNQLWDEIEAVAAELLLQKVLDATEVELICDAVRVDPDADVAAYRRNFPEVEEWRRKVIDA